MTFMKVLNAILGFFTRNAKRLVIAVAVIIMIAGVARVAYDVAFNFIRDDEYITYDQNGEQVTIEIPQGSSTGDIGTILINNGLIDNVLLFRIKAKLTGAEGEFQYGVYTFTKGMPDQMIMNTLKEGDKEKGVTITIPEGWSIRQIGEYLEEKEICLASEFEEACNRTDYDFDYYGVLSNTADRKYLLEGYLFPDTYDVLPAKGAEGVVERMLREFERKWEQHAGWKEQMEARGLTMDQVMTMASVIEREAALSEERPKVARVLLNRMDEGMNWGLNCTVLYALDKEGTGDDFVSYNDLTVESKYNTYKYLGYPVGPICNPGVASIQAALYPEDGDWLYFIGFEDGSGKHLFTSDYSEFEAVENGTYQKDESSQGEDGSEESTEGDGQ